MIKGLLGAVVAVVVLTSGVAAAQAYSGGEDTKGNLVLENKAGNNGSAEVHGYFGSSKGSYANAQEFLSPTTSNFCSYINGGQASCLGYTGECSSKVSSSTACGADPNGNPGEISCFCQDPSTLFGVADLGTVPPGNTLQIDTALLSDTDVDTKEDKRFFSEFSRNPQGSDQLRSYELFPGLYRLDWEDLHLAPQGDFNDYTSYVEMRSCSDEPGRPLYSIGNPEVQVPDCYDNCFKQDATCPSTSLTNDLKFAVSLSVDSAQGGERESRGRLMVVTVATYDTKPRHPVAVCPTVVFNSKTDYKFTSVTYGVEQTSQQLCKQASSMDGEPRCGNIDLIPNFWTVSLAREQSYAPSCGTKHTGMGDTFSTPAALKCGNPAPHFETYEVALADLDAYLDPADQISTLSDTDIINALHSVRLDVFEDIGVAPFHCGSGVNMQRYTSNPNVATMSSQSLVRGSSSFNLATTTRE